MMIKTSGIALSIVFASSSLSHAASNCEVLDIHLIQDVTVNGYMYVKTGKQCSIQSANAPGGNTSLELSERPSNGSVQVNELKLTYKPRAGFVGKDSFGYVRHALDYRNNQPVTYRVNVNVTVQP